MGQNHLPHHRLNLFHIDNQELHLDTLSVSGFLFNADISSLESRAADIKLEQPNLLQSGVLHVNSRSLIFDQDPTSKDLEPLQKWRYNSKFEFEVIQAENLEAIHQKVLDHFKAPARKKMAPLTPKMVLLDYFYKYLLYQTFPEALQPSLNWN